MKEPNKPDAVNPAVASRFHTGYHWRGVTDPERCGSDSAMSAQDVVRGYLAAYNAKDVTAMLVFFDDACVFENISGGKITVRTGTKAEFECLARRSAQTFATREQKIVSLTEGDGRIVVEIDYHAILEADLSPELKAGSQLELRGISVFECAGEKITRLTDYS